MAVTLVTSETHGAAAGTVVDSTTNINLLGTDAASGTVSTGSPIQIPAAGTAYSYERFIRAKFNGTFATVNNVKFYKSAGTLGTGYTIKAASRGANAYTTPVVTASSFATADVPTVVGSALTASSGDIVSVGGYSQYIVLQAQVTSSATTGSATAATYTWQWDETA